MKSFSACNVLVINLHIVYMLKTIPSRFRDSILPTSWGESWASHD